MLGDMEECDVMSILQDTQQQPTTLATVGAEEDDTVDNVVTISDEGTTCWYLQCYS